MHVVSASQSSSGGKIIREFNERLSTVWLVSSKCWLTAFVLWSCIVCWDICDFQAKVDWVRKPLQESSTFEVKVLISHLLDKVTEVFSKLIKSPEPLIFVTAGMLGLSDSHHRDCQNWSLHLRQTLTESKIFKQIVGSTLLGISEERPRSSLKQSTEPCPRSVPKLSYDVGVQWL